MRTGHDDRDLTAHLDGGVLLCNSSELLQAERATLFPFSNDIPSGLELGNDRIEVQRDYTLPSLHDSA